MTHLMKCISTLRYDVNEMMSGGLLGPECLVFGDRMSTVEKQVCTKGQIATDYNVSVV